MYFISDNRVRKMMDNNWEMILPEYNESDEHLKERLLKKYNQVKLYLTTTRIKGYHNTFAMVKGDKLYEEQ